MNVIKIRRAIYIISAIILLIMYIVDGSMLNLLLAAVCFVVGILDYRTRIRYNQRLKEKEEEILTQYKVKPEDIDKEK